MIEESNKLAEVIRREIPFASDLQFEFESYDGLELTSSAPFEKNKKNVLRKIILIFAILSPNYSNSISIFFYSLFFPFF